MNALSLTIIRVAFLAVLWLFVIAAIGVVRTDLLGGPSTTARRGKMRRDAEALERWLLAELDQVTGHADVDVHVRTRRGSPARELAAAAEEFSADALVIGAPKHIWHRVAGSVSGWLARHARCPVIVVP